MHVTNYFRVAFSKNVADCFPFLDGDRDDTVRAWELVLARASGIGRNVAVWRRPKCDGAWVLLTRRVGRNADELPSASSPRVGELEESLRWKNA